MKPAAQAALEQAQKDLDGAVATIPADEPGRQAVHLIGSAVINIIRAILEQQRESASIPAFPPAPPEIVDRG